MELTLDDLKKLSVITNAKLKSVQTELNKYWGLYFTFLQTEAINKIRRYGKKYYKDNYLKNIDGNISDFMTSYLYLKHTEEQLTKLKETLTHDKKTLTLEIKKLEDE